MLQPKLRIFATRSSVVSGEDETSGENWGLGLAQKSEETTGDVTGHHLEDHGLPVDVVSGYIIAPLVCFFVPPDLGLWDPFHSWSFFGLINSMVVSGSLNGVGGI